MNRLIATNSVPLGSADTYPLTGTPQYATIGNPLASPAVPPTVIPAYAWNMIQEELMAILAAADVTPVGGNWGQVLASLEVLFGSGHLLNVQCMFASGTYTPTPGTNKIEVFVQGAGGAAGGSPATGSGVDSCASGGGSGAFTYLYLASGVTSETVTIGAGGIGASGSSGGAGGASSFGALAIAPGGSGGQPAGPSGTGTTFLAVGGAGGVVGSAGTIPVPGTVGGSAIIITGTGFELPAAVGTFQAGYGAGGAPNANSPSSAAQVGASGKPGLVIVKEYS